MIDFLGGILTYLEGITLLTGLLTFLFAFVFGGQALFAGGMFAVLIGEKIQEIFSFFG
jgi:hypothetical protein